MTDVSVCVCRMSVPFHKLWIVIRLISMCALFDLYRFDGLPFGGLYRYASDFSISRIIESAAQKRSNNVSAYHSCTRRGRWYLREIKRETCIMEVKLDFDGTKWKRNAIKHIIFFLCRIFTIFYFFSNSFSIYTHSDMPNACMDAIDGIYIVLRCDVQ